MFDTSKSKRLLDHSSYELKISWIHTLFLVERYLPCLYKKSRAQRIAEIDFHGEMLCDLTIYNTRDFLFSDFARKSIPATLSFRNLCIDLSPRPLVPRYYVKATFSFQTQNSAGIFRPISGLMPKSKA